MKLRFFYQPVQDVEAVAAFYRDDLGFAEAWREGEDTVGLTVPGSDVVLMLDRDGAEHRCGLFFVVPSVMMFYEKNQTRFSFLEAPRAIGPGMFARFTDPEGNLVRVMDDSTSKHAHEGEGSG